MQERGAPSGWSALDCPHVLPLEVRLADLLIAALLAVAFCGSAAAGHALHGRLPEHHRSTQTLDFVRASSGLLVTFTALVLSLLLTTVHADFNRADTDLHTFGSMIIILDRELADLGAPARPARSLLRQYTAAAVASTWPEEPPPAGEFPKARDHGFEIDSAILGDLLHKVEGDIRRIVSGSGEGEKVQATCLSRISALLDQRWSLISEAHSSITPLFAMMVLWLLAVFLSFGLTAPRNRTASACIALVALSVAGAVFIILELDGPLDGLIKVQSEPLRHALRHLDEVPETAT